MNQLVPISSPALPMLVATAGDRLTPRAADGTPAYAGDRKFLLGRPR